MNHSAGGWLLRYPNSHLGTCRPDTCTFVHAHAYAICSCIVGKTVNHSQVLMGMTMLNKDGSRSLQLVLAYSGNAVNYISSAGNQGCDLGMTLYDLGMLTDSCFLL